MKKLATLILVLIIASINALGQTVYISTGSSAKKYHSTSSCRGLANSKYIKSISIEDAHGIGRTPCMICMSTTTEKYKEQHKTVENERQSETESEMLEVRYHNIENQISANKKQMREFSKSSIEYKVRKEENKALKEQMNKIDEEYFELTGRYIYNGGEN